MINIDNAVSSEQIKGYIKDLNVKIKALDKQTRKLAVKKFNNRIEVRKLLKAELWDEAKQLNKEYIENHRLFLDIMNASIELKCIRVAAGKKYQRCRQKELDIVNLYTPSHDISHLKELLPEPPKGWWLINGKPVNE